MSMFYERLHELRTERGMSRSELAARLGVSARLVAYWESGQRECSFDTLLRIAEVLEVSTDCLLGRTEY